MTSAVLVCVALVFTSSCLYECVNGKVNYVHWGKSGCPVAGLTDVHDNGGFKPVGDRRKRETITLELPVATAIYTGYVAKSMWQGKGAGSEFICLPNRPEWGTVIPDMQSSGAWQNSRIYGTQFFEVGLSPDLVAADTNLADVPCTVCETLFDAHQLLMIPGRLNCPKLWRKQYAGLLMAEPSKRKKSQSNYICVDQSGFDRDNQDEKPHARLSPVEVGCGIIPCAAYSEGRELTCVVCVK